MVGYRKENLLVKHLYSDAECVTVVKEDNAGSITLEVEGSEDLWLAYFGLLVTQPIPSPDAMAQQKVTWRDGIYMQALKVYVEKTSVEIDQVVHRFTAQLY